MAVAPSASDGQATKAVEDDADGVALALTVMSAVKWWGLVELPLFFAYIRLRRSSLAQLKRLSFIHAARWSLVRRLPANGRLPEFRFRYPRLYFESNFNGGWEEYIDAFSYVLTSGMWGFWGSSYGFPKAVPPGPFKEYIRENAHPTSHYYSAYPEATATMVLGSLQLEPKVRELHERAAGMSPEEFARAWQALLTESQQWL
jgi:hypothetical protein